MEEWVGEKWHHFITGKTQRRYPQAAIRLEDVQTQLAVYFRALGGDAGVSLGHTSAKVVQAHRNWLHIIAGTGKKAELAHFSRDHLYLPEVLECHPTRALNQSLYFWLAALASLNQSPHAKHLIEHNQYLTRQVLARWPGLTNIYTSLSQAELNNRPALSSLPHQWQHTERLLRLVLTDPHGNHTRKGETAQLSQPVIMWLQSTDQALATKGRQDQAGHTPQHSADQVHTASHKRHQAEHTDTQEEEGGFMSFRLESLFSWSEFINLERSEDDSGDEDVMRVAEDLDHLSINQGEAGHTIKLDLDLPGSDYDDVQLSEGILLPEWDHRKQRLQKDHCALQLMALRLTETHHWPTELKPQANRLRRQFEALKPISYWQNKQADGDEIDFHAVLEHRSSQQQQATDANLFRRRAPVNRDLATLILTDLSLSTDAHVNNDKKVIDVIKESLFLLSAGLSAADERFAIAGFTSRKRNHVRYYPIKSFEQPFDQRCEEQIQAIRPAYYTRMGAAIRYATRQLNTQNNNQKLLLILTDGKPNDLDIYEGRYGLEDTRQAITEARQQGLTPFCVSIDYQAADYLPYLFGNQGFIHLNNALDLPRKLPRLFVQLTQ
ncbi:nitric oxide reductase activation protein NorD [Marinicella sediminis]|uniref:Nitric oxide reductase activation protein NorD n=1 Tax=Marinicella sediminis TaxID=1792834 RepID=A0ABV7JF97_9GAMM|nr:VWA domain-containing protein [Marinicella sediminis]